MDTKKIAKYKILKEHELLIAVYAGKITLQDIVDMNAKVFSEPQYDTRFDTIVDIRNFDENITVDEIKSVVEFYKEQDNKITDKRFEALLSTKQKVTAKSLIFDELTKNLPMLFKTVTTFKGAFDWVGLDKEHRNKVKLEIEKLSQQ